jgi:hypothetical protein
MLRANAARSASGMAWSPRCCRSSSAPISVPALPYSTSSEAPEPWCEADAQIALYCDSRGWMLLLGEPAWSLREKGEAAWEGGGQA